MTLAYFRQNHLIHLPPHKCLNTCSGSSSSLTWCRCVCRRATHRGNGSRPRSGLLGLCGTCRGDHRGGRGPAPLALKMRGSVGGEGGLSLVTCVWLFPLAAAAVAAGGSASTGGWAQASLNPSGKVIDWARQILEQKKRLTVSIYETHPSISSELTCSRWHISM